MAAALCVGAPLRTSARLLAPEPAPALPRAAAFVPACRPAAKRRTASLAAAALPRVRPGSTVVAAPARATRWRATRLRCAAAAQPLAELAAHIPLVIPGISTLQQDAGAAVLAAAGALLVIKTCDYLAQEGLLDRTLTRKLVHIISGTGFLLTWLLFSDSSEARYIAACVPLANGVRLAAIGSGVLRNDAAVKAISREGDPKELLRGPLIYVVAMVVATCVFWRNSPVGVIAISLMCGGDGLADVVGRRLGKNNKLPFNKGKSYAGSAAMFLGSLGFAVATLSVFVSAGAFTLDWSATMPPLLFICAAATAVEALPLTEKLDDNVTVPSVAMLLSAMLLS